MHAVDHFLMPNLCLECFKLNYHNYTVRAGEVRNFVDFRQITFHGTTSTITSLLIHVTVD